MKPGDPAEKWRHIESYFARYETNWSPVRWFDSWGGLFLGREGLYITVRFILLSSALIGSFELSGFLQIAVVLLSGFFIFDILAAHTAIVFITGKPGNHLRSVVMSFFSYFQLGIGFAVMYSSVGECFSPKLTALRSLYFSFVTITTLGYGDVHPQPDKWQAQILIITEIITGVYFLTVFIARIVGWTMVTKDKTM